MKKKNIIFIYLILIISCDVKKEENNSKVIKENITVKSNVLNSAKNETKIKQKFVSLLNLDIMVKNIKSQLDGVTTTFLTKDKSSFYIERYNNNFFGVYTLIKNDRKGTPRDRVGYLIIYDSINPYKYEKDTEDFVEITLNKKGIVILNDKLKIGMEKELLFKELGTIYDSIDNTIIFSLKDKKAFFKIQNNIVTKLKIGIYKDGINFRKLLKKSNW